MWKCSDTWKQLIIHQNCIHEQIKSRMNAGNACNHPVQNLGSSHLLLKNIKITHTHTHTSIKFLAVLYGCIPWSVTISTEYRLWVFENRVLRKIYWTKRDEVTKDWVRQHSEEFHDLHCSPNISWLMKSRRMRWAGHVTWMRKRSAYRFWAGKPEGKRSFGMPRQRRNKNLKWIFKQQNWMVWTRLIWHRTQTGWLLYMWQNFKYHIVQEIP